MTDLREQEMQSQIDALSSKAENWKNTAENLKTENQMLKAQVAQLQKMVYGSRTERTKRILPETADGQLNLFNEAEVEAKKNAPEPCIEVPAHQRRKKQKDHTAELLANSPHEERLITLPEEERVCKRCGTALTSMGKEKIRTEIEFIPAKVKVIDYYRESFQCLACRKEAHFSIEKPAMPQPVIAKSIASPSSVAHVMVQKYQQSMPLYRQEREWKEIGIPLSRATLANWVIRPAEDWLMPLAARLQQDLLQQDVIHADETPVQVHKEKGRKNPAKSYMWVFSSGEYEQAHPIRLYEYQPGRSGSYAEDFLKGFNGILQTDGYTGYQKVPCQAHALCGRMQDGTLSKPFRQICRKKTSSAASAKKLSSGSTSSLPSTKGLQNSRKKSAKNSVSSLKKRSSRLISHGFRTLSRKCCRNPSSAKRFSTP